MRNLFLALGSAACQIQTRQARRTASSIRGATGRARARRSPDCGSKAWSAEKWRAAISPLKFLARAQRQARLEAALLAPLTCALTRRMVEAADLAVHRFVFISRLFAPSSSSFPTQFVRLLSISTKFTTYARRAKACSVSKLHSQDGRHCDGS